MERFDVKGFEKFGELGDRMKKDIANQIDLAAKTSVNKTADLVAYGKITGINDQGGNEKGIVRRVARTLRVPAEHIYYRTFIAGVKVTEGKGSRGVKPYASLMIRGNAIGVVDLLLKGNEAKARYGFKTRKKKVGGKARPNMRSKASSARTSGGVTINGKTYKDAYIEDGSYRMSKRKVGKLTMNQYYMQKLGANTRALKGQMQVLRRKNSGQKLPYPTKRVEISKARVIGALNIAALKAKTINNSEIDSIMKSEVKRRMKKLGFDLNDN